MASVLNPNTCIAWGNRSEVFRRFGNEDIPIILKSAERCDKEEAPIFIDLSQVENFEILPVPPPSPLPVQAYNPVTFDREFEFQERNECQLFDELEDIFGHLPAVEDPYQDLALEMGEEEIIPEDFPLEEEALFEEVEEEEYQAEDADCYELPAPGISVAERRTRRAVRAPERFGW